MKYRVALILAILFSSAPSFAAETRSNPVAVFELFTSQGCSSCPPADALLQKYGARQDVIALAYHVDYWDYIGWQDTFGTEANSDFQRAYATAQGKGRIYTPQLMVNGVNDVVGSRQADIDQAVAAARLFVPITLEVENEILLANMPGIADLPESTVWLVAFKSRAPVAIERGENRGQTIGYSHVVTHRQVLGMWEPESGAHIKLPLAEAMGPDSDGLAIIIQQEQNHLPGRILGAASYIHRTSD